ncbi:MAG TPA: hypothetical protein VMK12_31315 [Anaeromyxobacteraceae bacterium]|nr:hypothetical protein [Anaeromyxobacteraceae bacterium]
MQTILQATLDVAGVGAAIVFDDTGRLVCHRGHAIYDQALCEQLGASLAKAVDAVELQHEEWETISARYSDGKLILRNLGSIGGSGHVLAVVADASLNLAFATVAIRVAANKLKKALGGGASSSALSGTLPADVPAQSSATLARSSSILGGEPVAGAVERAAVQDLLAIYTNYLGPAAKLVFKQQLAALGVTSRTLRRSQVDEFVALLAAKIPVAVRQREFGAAIREYRERTLI